jgi:hypothetical protein
MGFSSFVDSSLLHAGDLYIVEEANLDNDLKKGY